MSLLLPAADFDNNVAESAGAFWKQSKK